MARKATARQEPETPPVSVVAPEAPPESSPKKEPTSDFKPTPAYTGRAAVLAEIADRNREKRDASLREDGGDVVDTRSPVKPGDDVDAAAEARDNEEEDAGAENAGGEEGVGEAAPQVEAPKTRKYIVDGQEVEFTEDQITRAVQLHATADKRVRDATLLLEGARRSVTDATRGDGSASPPPSGSSPAAGKPPLSDADVGKLSKAILYGSEEEVRGALSTLVSSIGSSSTARVADMAGQPQMKPEDLRSFVSEAIAFENANSYLDRPPEQGGFADVWTDPVLKTSFMQLESEIANEFQQAGKRATYLEIYALAAQKIRGWRDGLVQKYAPKTGLEDRGELKRSAGVVRGAGGTPPSAPQESPPLTREQTLDKMRKARGQT